ncbi:hypothetical protein PD653_0611 [Nocardioides sp. PD653]|nr:hypothetical protein PD653B2_1377 [Nocardioides sp. PD653-B2]GAW53213.1 hypothetical protein PD653_0611 [Nocardioides sp. PD653]
MGEVADRRPLGGEQLHRPVGQPVEGPGQLLGLLGSGHGGSGLEVSLAELVGDAGHLAHRLAHPLAEPGGDEQRQRHQQHAQADDARPGGRHPAAQVVGGDAAAHDGGPGLRHDREQHPSARVVHDLEALTGGRAAHLGIAAHAGVRADDLLVGGEHAGAGRTPLVEVVDQAAQLGVVLQARHQDCHVARLLVGRSHRAVLGQGPDQEAEGDHE